MADRLPAASVACVAAGAACTFAFAPRALALLAPLALALLFHFCSRSTPGQAFRLGYLFGLGLFGAGVHWLRISIHLFGGLGSVASTAVTFLLIAFLALFPAAAAWAAARCRGDSPARDLLLAQPAAWVLGEWLRGWLFTGFPWLLVGYTQIDLPPGALAPVTGVFGLSWFVALGAGTLVLLARPGRRQRVLAATMAAALLVVTLAAGQGRWTHDTGVTRTVALVQGAVPLEVKWNPEFLHQSVQRYVTLTAPHWDSDIIIWPETAIPAFASQVPDLLRELGAEAVRQDADLYVGFPTVAPAGDRYFNSLLLLGAGVLAYDKRHLVPFGEFTPFAPVLRGFAELLNIPMSNFSRGTQARPLLQGRHGIAGVSICYEDVFGAEVIEALPDADLLINISNDGWFGDSAAPHQHLQMARMRALETGRYLLRATNSGISAIIDPDGNVTARAPQFAPTVLAGSITLHTGATPYVRAGDWPVIVLLVLAVIAAWRRRS